MKIPAVNDESIIHAKMNLIQIEYLKKYSLAKAAAIAILFISMIVFANKSLLLIVNMAFFSISLVSILKKEMIVKFFSVLLAVAMLSPQPVFALGVSSGVGEVSDLVYTYPQETRQR